MYGRNHGKCSMEIKDVTDSMFLPLMIQRELDIENIYTVSLNHDYLMNSGLWVEDVSGMCYIPNLIKVELSFDGDINDIENFDRLKSEVFSIVATAPKFIVDDLTPNITDDQNTNMMKNIMNCFSGKMMELQEDFILFDSLIEHPWTYRISMDHRIYPCVVNGTLAFECI